jgi:hypothetical protein
LIGIVIVILEPSESFAVFLRLFFEISSIVDVSWWVRSNRISSQSNEEFNFALKHFTHP